MDEVATAVSYRIHMAGKWAQPALDGIFRALEYGIGKEAKLAKGSDLRWRLTTPKGMFIQDGKENGPLAIVYQRGSIAPVEVEAMLKTLFPHAELSWRFHGTEAWSPLPGPRQDA
jgi:hypothetical protein